MRKRREGSNHLTFDTMMEIFSVVPYLICLSFLLPSDLLLVHLLSSSLLHYFRSLPGWLVISKTDSWGVIIGVVGVIIRFCDNAFDTIVIINNRMTPSPRTQCWSTGSFRHSWILKMTNWVELKIFEI